MSRRPAFLVLAACVLAVAAAVVSFAQGSWLGVVWVLLAGVTSNMGWYYLRRAGGVRKQAVTSVCGGDGTACAGCVRRICQ
ncbi:hypothetical protein [Streptomyces sp. NPDC047000]|uniref:hypothetical protein n=1 Tax=Streptomyces sp. NPDC047000 TaxID=3155474 RepID=UPI00340C1F9F